MSDLGKLIGAEIRRARKSAGLTAIECATRAGMARPNWVRLETGRHTPSVEMLVRVAVALRCPLSELLASVEARCWAEFAALEAT